MGVEGTYHCRSKTTEAIKCEIWNQVPNMMYVTAKKRQCFDLP